MFFGKKKKVEQEPIQFVEGSFLRPAAIFVSTCRQGPVLVSMSIRTGRNPIV